MHRPNAVGLVGFAVGSGQSALRRRGVAFAGLAFVIAAGLIAVQEGVWAGQPQAGQQGSLYVRQGSWAETMLSARKRYLEYRQVQRQKLGRLEAQPFVSPPIAGGGPGMKVSVDVSGWRWMRLVTVLEQGGGNCHIWGDAKLIAKDGTAVWLGDLRPVTVRVGWGQLLVDRNWQNEPLRIGTRKFEHGIWVHADSDVCYALDGKYERFEAWVGMDAARAIGVARFKVMFEDPNLAEEMWRRLAADFPEPMRWFAADVPGDHRRWLERNSDTQLEQAAIGRVLGALGAQRGGLDAQFEALRRQRASPDDRRWLELYLRACRYRQCRAVVDGMGVPELQRRLEAECQALLVPEVSPEDPRWPPLLAKAQRLASVLGQSRWLDAGAMRSAMELLARALPGRFAPGPELASRIEAFGQRAPEVIARAASGEDPSQASLAAWVAEGNELGRQLVLALRGMKEFLAVPAHAGLEKEWLEQYEMLELDLANRPHFEKVAAQTFRQAALVLPEDRDPADIVLRRTAALLADLKRTAAASSLSALEKELGELQAASANIDPAARHARYVLYADACRLRRQIAWKNPLLAFDQILFIKRHRALYNHMCDQYYGMAATPGGGLYILSGAFGPEPKVRDVLANSVVQRGRLKGKALSGGPTTPPPVSFDGMGNRHGEDNGGGSFLSPDLSFDAKTILFAYVENQGDTRHRHHTDPSQGHWHEGRCYHIFKVNVDGTGLEQLTDGTWNDFDPCFLPNGRIAFISERRGGYLRCGRVCPTYTLYDMAADGSDITCLSFHETNEWHPSVTHDGRIVYTRWDYVDRHGCTAHLPWITTLDGRDSRAVHGNFAPRHLRPDMELDCRAVPGSPKFVATAAPHHGQAYGSLVLIDPRVPDDDAMGPVKRLTPEVGFPESQGGAQAYGTPWPLSEDYHLCIYDAGMRRTGGFQGERYQRGNYGIYLVDAFGNKELIYRDPEISGQSPIPVVPRPKPVVAPELVRRGPDTDPAVRTRLPARNAEATVALVNVYDSLKPWPPGTRIKEVRVLQVLPMTVPSGAPPHETALRVATAGDSVVPVRYVLGTAPVEEDGSAHFIVPANKELFFQAIDQDGLAVQSMRSATYLHEGERLVCLGCHEPKHRSPQPLRTIPLALRREPSRLVPDVDGTNPFSYPRLVQPVLDRHCVQCHAEKSDKAPNLGREPIVRKWFASYNTLAPQFGFSDYGDPYRTTPGRFGARASKLYELLRKGHYDVKLPPEDWHRLAVWLDCTSLFYGVYEKEGGEAQLRGEVVRPTLE